MGCLKGWAAEEREIGPRRWAGKGEEKWGGLKINKREMGWRKGSLKIHTYTYTYMYIHICIYIYVYIYIDLIFARFIKPINSYRRGSKLGVNIYFHLFA